MVTVVVTYYLHGGPWKDNLFLGAPETQLYETSRQLPYWIIS